MAELAALAGTIGTFLSQNAAVISTAATIGGTAIGAAGTLAAGQAAQDQARFEASQLQAKGLEEQAAAQREAEQYRRQKALALSTLQARSAASGFTATDPTTLTIGDEIAKYGTLQEQMALYGGASRRAGYEGQAQARRIEGRAARQGSKYQAAATILGGISTMADRFAPRPQVTINKYRYGSAAPVTGWGATVKPAGGYG